VYKGKCTPTAQQTETTDANSKQDFSASHKIYGTGKKKTLIAKTKF
jgi:hypothetical protein